MVSETGCEPIFNSIKGRFGNFRTSPKGPNRSIRYASGDRDRRFESDLLQQRVNKLSVPLHRWSFSITAFRRRSPPTGTGEIAGAVNAHSPDPAGAR